MNGSFLCIQIKRYSLLRMKIAGEKIIIETPHRGNNTRENRSNLKTGLIHVYRCIHVKT